MPLAEINFDPRGQHSGGLDISAAQTLTQPNGATWLLVQALTQNVRLTLDGTLPSGSVGFQIKAGDPPVLIPVTHNTIVRVVQEAATASLQFQWGGFAQ
jgi:hypothetical protein